MPSTYTSNNKIQKIATGEQSGTWGSTTNTNFDLFDTAIDGFVAVAVTGTTTTLNIPDGSAADGRNKVLSFTGALSAANTVSVTPNTVKKHYFVQNNTTGSQNIIIYQGSGSTVTIKPGYSSVVYLDGAGGSASAKEVLTSLKLTALLEATGAVFVGSTSGSTTLQATAVASGTLTLPAATDTLVGKATTDTFTNKTLDTAGTGNVLRINGTQVSAVTGTGSVVLATSPTLVTPALGTPTSGTLTSCTGLPISTGVSGLGSGVATFLATPSSSNLATAVTDETGSGALVFATSPTLVTPLLGTPTSGTLTSCTGLPISTGVSGLGTSVATFLATPSSANLATAVTDETGTGSLVFATSPTIVTPTITTSAVIPLVNGGTAAASTLTIQSTSGAGTSDAIIFNTASQSEKMRILTGGNVGIGTASPGATLPSGMTASAKVLEVRSNTAAQDVGLFLRRSDGVTGLDIWHDGSSDANYDTRFVNIFSSSAFAFYNGTTEQLRILSGGNVGIGTASPGTKLEVFGSITARAATTQDAVIVAGRAGGTSGFGVTLTPTTLTASRTVTLADGDTTLATGTMAVTSGTLAQFAATTSAQLAGVISDETGTGSLVFATSPTIVTPTVTTSAVIPLVNGGTAVSSTLTLQSTSGAGSSDAIVFKTASQSERMRITTAGNVGIGVSNPTGKLEVVGGRSFFNAASEQFAVGARFISTGGSVYFGATNGTATPDVQISSSGGSALMTMLNAGNVGIGTTSPAQKLTVDSGSVKVSKGYSYLFDDANDEIRVDDSPAWLAVSNTMTLKTYAGAFVFQNSNGAASIMTVRADTSRVGIGVTGPNYKLEISTDSAGKPGVGGLWTVVSDERIKTDITPADLDRCYEIVKSVPLKHFGFAPGVYTDDQINDKHSLGWVAQDVQKVFSKAVSVKPFTLKTAIPDGTEEYEEQDFTMETVEKTETSIQVIDGKPVQVSKVVTSENKVLLFDTVDVVDEAGAVVMDGDKPLTYQMPRMVTKTRNKVRHDVIEDCLDLNGGQMIAALYGAVQALMLQVESLKAGN